MNIYRHQFVSKCPNNGDFIVYDFELRKPDEETVFVEHIVIASKLWNPAFHEQIADAFFKQFGGQQILKAHHHGVEIETKRGFEPLSFLGKLARRVQVGKTVYEKGVDVQLVADAATRKENACESSGLSKEAAWDIGAR